VPGTGTVVVEQLTAEDLMIGAGEVTVTAPASGTMIGTRINITTFGVAARYLIALGTIPGQSNVSFNIVMNGIQLGMPVLACPEANLGPDVFEIDARVFATNTLRLSVFNRNVAAAVLGNVYFNVVALTFPTITPVEV
jgi:hypothetical protein